jgi:hypothetical protein
MSIAESQVIPAPNSTDAPQRGVSATTGSRPSSRAANITMVWAAVLAYLSGPHPRLTAVRRRVVMALGLLACLAALDVFLFGVWVVTGLIIGNVTVTVAAR